MGVKYDDFDFFPDHPIGEFIVSPNPIFRESTPEKTIEFGDLGRGETKEEKKFDEDLEIKN